jgi:hypothetical protein
LSGSALTFANGKTASEAIVSAPRSNPALAAPARAARRWVFEEGKRGFLIMPLETTQPDGSTVRPAFARCELPSLGR